MIEVVGADESHEPGIHALAQRTLGWTDDPLFEALFRWKHDENAFGRSPRWVAVEGDRVVGFRVFLRWQFTRADGSVARAVRAVDTATDPDYQGQGIFKRLTTSALDDLRADGIDFIFNTPNDQSRPGYLKMGWIDLGRPPVAMAPRIRSIPAVAMSRVAADLWSQPTEVGASATTLGDAAVAARLLAAAPAPGSSWQTDRSPAWLAWRFGLDALQYRVLRAGDAPGGDRHGDAGAIFRLRRRGRAIEATISDVFAGNAAARRFLVRAVLRATRADYAIVAGERAVDVTPSFSLPAFSPMVTWRSVNQQAEPALNDFRFAVGDLELF